jgi:hypothetical protein
LTKLRSLVFVLSLTVGVVSAAVSSPAPIAPINAPFPMPQLQRPAFPEREFSITNFGAVGDGVTLNIENIQRAIDACYTAGGGTVVVPAGHWLTTPLQLKSKVNLHLAAGAEVVFTDEKKYYYAGLGVFDAPPRVASQNYAPELTNVQSPRPLLSAYDCENIAVTGPGRLDGLGMYWWPIHTAWFKKSGAGYPPEAVKRAWRGLDPAVEYVRPYMIQFMGCSNVLLEDFTVVNSPFWTINPVVCQNVIARKLTVRASGPSGNAPNTDGINPESCRNVLVENCDIDTGDDSVAIKSGADAAGRKRGIPSENIVIRHLHARRIAIGSEMSGGVRNVFIHDCQMTGMGSVFNIKTRRGRGGAVENIFVQDIDADPASNALVHIDMEYWTQKVPAPPEPLSERTPRIRNLSFKNIHSTAAGPDGHALSLNGLPEMPIENVSFENLRLGRERAIVCQHARGITFKDVTLTAIAPMLAITDCQELSFPGLALPATSSPFLTVAGKETRAIRFNAALEGRRDAIVFEDGATPDAVTFSAPISRQ